VPAEEVECALPGVDRRGSAVGIAGIVEEPVARGGVRNDFEGLTERPKPLADRRDVGRGNRRVLLAEEREHRAGDSIGLGEQGREPHPGALPDDAAAVEADGGGDIRAAGGEERREAAGAESERRDPRSVGGGIGAKRAQSGLQIRFDAGVVETCQVRPDQGEIVVAERDAFAFAVIQLRRDGQVPLAGESPADRAYVVVDAERSCRTITAERASFGRGGALGPDPSVGAVEDQDGFPTPIPPSTL
jgi:hypothetical protein